MVDLKSQYKRLKKEIDPAIQAVIDSGTFIKGPALKTFEKNLAKYLGVKHVIGVANGTDALQIALMALDLKLGDEIIVPAFTYAATAEVIGLLGLRPVMVDVYEDTFNINTDKIRKAITPRTRAIVPVHLYGQTSDMEGVLSIAKEFGLKIVEDNAQALGADYSFSSGQQVKSGTIGDIGCTSFFPSKNLGCFGDGGAIFTNSDELAEDVRMIANHGQRKKYYHDVLGVNSRLDTIQAAVLDVKLKHLDDFAARRNKVADAYDVAFADLNEIEIPFRSNFSTHVFHQYTLKVKNGRRDGLKVHLQDKGVPSMIYYPLPLYKQDAFKEYFTEAKLVNTELLCDQVLSLPIHTEMQEDVQAYIIKSVKEFVQ